VGGAGRGQVARPAPPLVILAWDDSGNGDEGKASFMPARQHPSKQTIVVVEDDSSIRELLELYLAHEGYAARSAGTASEALLVIAQSAPSLVVLDLMLPDESGFEVLRRLRKGSQVPVIILTARDAENDKILGLELGADDYVVKPFSPGELLARIRAVLRRSGALDPGSDTQVLGEVVLSPAERTVKVDGVMVDLTPKEFDLLHYLLLNRGLALTRERLLEQVWGYNLYGDVRTVDVHIGQVRKKLGRWGKIIKTVWGVGYRADPDEAPAEEPSLDNERADSELSTDGQQAPGEFLVDDVSGAGG